MKKKLNWLQKVFELPKRRIKRIREEKMEKARKQKQESIKEQKRNKTYKDGSRMPARYFKNDRDIGMKETKGGKGRKKPKIRNPRKRSK